MACIRTGSITHKSRGIRRNRRRCALRQAVNWGAVAWWLMIAAVIVGSGLMWGSEPDVEKVDRPVYIGATADATVDAGVDYK